MNIKNLEVFNFRNYEYEKEEFVPGLNLIVGANGQGKTNLVEAIYLLSLGRSFRTNKDKEMVRFEKEHAIVSGVICSGDREHKIEIKIGNELKKAVKINSIPIDRLSDLLGIFNVVVFAPEDLKLVKEGPKERRNFMDREISQIRPLYYNHIAAYRKSLLQRNNLLKSFYVDRELLEVYDHQLATLSWQIMNIRRDFMKKIAPIAMKNHRKISSEKEELQVIYEPDIGKKREIPDVETIKNLFKKNHQEDIQKKTTGLGPHKDDIVLKINGIDIRSYGSQGQKRSAAISLKLSEIEIIKEEKGEYPVVLLDDIFSELDPTRQGMLLKNMEDIQTFVTTAGESIDYWKKDEMKIFYSKSDKKIFQIENAKINRL